MRMARVLVPGDEPVISTFLEAHPDETMFLRSNLAKAGLRDRGRELEGTWAAAFDGDEVIGAGAVFWNGMLVLAAPHGLGSIAAALAAATPRPLAGLIGPWGQVDEARHCLGLADRAPRLESHEDLFALDLSELRAPARGDLFTRRATAADL